MATLQEHEKRITSLETDMWFGKDADNPSVVLRLDRVERVVSELKTLKWTVLAAGAAAVADIIRSHLK